MIEKVIEMRKSGKATIAAVTLAVLLGTGLLAAWLWTGKGGISEEDREIYEAALGLQEPVDELGFQDFTLADYPVAMYDGRSDYVFYRGKIEKRSPVLETFAGTAYPVEDHFEVIIPTMEKFDSLLSLAGGVEGMVTGSGYGEAEQKATLWHEAFHAYQMTNFAVLGEKITAEEMQDKISENVRKSYSDGKEGGNQAEMSGEEWIVKEVDQKEDIKTQLETEMKLLQKAAKKAVKMNGTNVDGLRDDILEYSKRRKQRLAKMQKEAAEAEIRCELTEGTAYYVESKVYKMLSKEDAYEERYLENIKAYEGGRGKYYRTGMAKCLILDRMYPDWKKTFDFEKGLDEVLEEYGEQQEWL